MSTAELNGARIAYEVRGSGPAVTLIHEGIADRRMWREAVPVLEPHFTVVTYDQRGFGDSSLPSGTATYVDDLRALLDHLGLERTTLVGASLGGRVALELTLFQPERVDRLVLVAAGLPDWDWSDEVKRFGEQEDQAYGAGDLDRAVELNLALWVDGPGRGPDAVDPAMRAFVGEMQRRAFEIPLPDPEPTSPPPLEPPARRRLGHIAMPTLVMIGDADVEDMQQIADVLAEGIPGAQKVTLADTAHMIPLERPAEFNRILLDFLHTEAP
ncbi:MAG: alpha/beta hydrolase [Actinomycetota bacterium]|nr:alpha/beta hydrolase [Actinomycetota bacterium]